MGAYAVNAVPRLYRRRSIQDLSHSVKTSGNVGTLYPFDVQEVYPGDSFKVKTSVVTRLTSTFLKPVVDNLFMDVYHFWCPSRQLYQKWNNIFGENTESPYANTVEYEAPSLVGPRSVFAKSVAQYLGMPVGTLSGNIPINILPFRAFAKVYNEWFRDQNNVNPMHIQFGETTTSEQLNNNAWAPNNYFGKLPKVSKLHDYFTVALPSPQKGQAPLIPVEGLGQLPVVAVGSSAQNVSSFPLVWTTGGPGSPMPSSAVLLSVEGTTSAPGHVPGGTYSSGSGSSNFYPSLAPGNLFADGTAENLGIGVNGLRFAVQYQRMLERDARSGSRYFEYLRAAFGVEIPSVEIQRTEFLGGRRIPISITQVTQSTGENDESSPLGSVAGYSLSGGSTKYSKGFLEHGYVISVFCIRQFHTYQQGLEKFWTRTKRTDFYDPVFSNLGEQPIYKSELFAFGETIDQERQVFGYGEAWADLRRRQGRVSGQLVSGIQDSLDVWHFGDYYDNAPTLNSQFIEETPIYVDRAIGVESSVQDQFLIDFWIDNKAYRVLPTFSYPGLVDHN